MVNLTPADISDSAGAQIILDTIRKRWRWVKHLFADGAYDRIQLMSKAAYLDFVAEVIRRRDRAKGFEVLPRRWAEAAKVPPAVVGGSLLTGVERTFGWMTRRRRLVRYYERRIDVSHAMVLVAMRANLTRRNAHPQVSKQALRSPHYIDRDHAELRIARHSLPSAEIEFIAL